MYYSVCARSFADFSSVNRNVFIQYSIQAKRTGRWNKLDVIFFYKSRIGDGPPAFHFLKPLPLICYWVKKFFFEDSELNSPLPVGGHISRIGTKLFSIATGRHSLLSTRDLWKSGKCVQPTGRRRLELKRALSLHQRICRPRRSGSGRDDLKRAHGVTEVNPAIILNIWSAITLPSLSFLRHSWLFWKFGWKIL